MAGVLQFPQLTMWRNFPGHAIGKGNPGRYNSHVPGVHEAQHETQRSQGENPTGSAEDAP